MNTSINPTTSRARRRYASVLLVGAAALALTACGSRTEEAAPTPTAAPAAAPAATAAPAPTAAPETTAAPAAEPAPETTAAPAPPTATGPVAKIASSPLGDVLTDTNGMTLYGFTNDVAAVSTCVGTCADQWPPVIVSADFAVGPGLDVGFFATAPRDDGSLQLVAGKFPLYTFAGDAVQGDITGHGSGDVWFAMNTDGTLYPGDAPTDGGGGEAGEAPAEEGAAAIVSTATIDLGDILVDANGLSLYGFTDDDHGHPTCNDACADAWPPIIVEGNTLPEGLDPAIFSVAERADGTFQLQAGKWPLYLFAADREPGDVAGQGSGGVWFVVTPTGELIR